MLQLQSLLFKSITVNSWTVQTVTRVTVLHCLHVEIRMLKT